jgi:hypothetical protein
VHLNCGVLDDPGPTIPCAGAPDGLTCEYPLINEDPFPRPCRLTTVDSRRPVPLPSSCRFGSDATENAESSGCILLREVFTGLSPSNFLGMC